MGKWHKNSKFVCSAVFGTEIWPAAEYGRTMYTMRQRVGPLLMKMQKRYGRLFTNSFISYSRLAVINFFCYIINFLVLSRLNKKRHIHRRTTALQHLQLSSHWCRKSKCKCTLCCLCESFVLILSWRKGLRVSGKMEQTGELSEKEIIRAERNSGVISNRVREIQVSMIS